MPSTNANLPIYYNALYRHGVDEKRRVQIPAKWRPVDPDFQFTLILWPATGGKEPYLLALPPEPMAQLVAKVTSMPYSDPKADSLRRLLGRNSDTVGLDKSGRICIPEQMADGAGISKEAVLVGSWDRFEIWNPQRYEAADKLDAALASDAFKLI
jgi:MraZ protein